MAGNRPSKGRKSLLTQQAELVGLSFTSGQVESILQDLPRNFKENAANPNLQSRRTGSIGRLSELATPLQPIPMPRGSSQIPVARRLPLTAEKSLGRGSSRPKPSNSNATRGSGHSRGRSGLHGSTSGMRLGRNPLRRSTSVESFNVSSTFGPASYHATPLNRGRSQSPGPLSTSKKSATRGRAGEMIPKTLQAPLSTDKTSLSKMINLIIELLKKFRYEKDFTISTFKMLNVKDFTSICIFLLTYMIGPNIGPNKKDEQTYILDGIRMLGYPSTVSKSHLKQPNVPHTQPIIYTLLSWLCCLVDVYMDPNSQEIHKCNLLSKEAELEEILAESYTRLFFRYIAEGKTDVTDELERYREQIKNLWDDDMGPEYANIAQEEIQFMVDEKQAYKDSLFFSTKDPRKDIQSSLKAQDEMLCASKKRIAELEEKKRSYSNITSMESEATVLNSELSRLRRSLSSLQETVSTQELSREMAEQLLEQTATLKKQQESAEKINQQLQLKVQQQDQFLENDMTRFYETCSRFSFLDMYNNIAKNFEGLFPQIEKNPLDALELENWLKDVMEKITAAKRILDIRMVEWQERDQMADRKYSQLETKVHNLEADCEQASSELSAKYSENNKKFEQLEYEVQKARVERNTLKESRLKLVEEIAELKNKQLCLTKKVEETDKYIEELKQYKAELDASVEDNFAIYHKAEVELKQMLLAFVIDARKKVHAPPTEEELAVASKIVDES